jgi:hypothetical protein
MHEKPDPSGTVLLGYIGPNPRALGVFDTFEWINREVALGEKKESCDAAAGWFAESF